MQQAVASAGERAVTRIPESCSFSAQDGVSIFYRHWNGSGHQAVVLIHRGHEHSGRMAHLVDELDLPECSFFGWDARAHGRSGGEQGPATTMATFVQDLDDFVRHICGAYGIKPEDIAVVAQSVGAVIAAAWVHDYAPPIRALVLAAPAFRVKLYVPFARLGIGFWHKIAGDFFVQSYVKGRALTHDAERMASYHTDPLVKLQISARVLLDLYSMSERLLADAEAIRVPAQILLSGSDWVIRNTPPQDFFGRISTPAADKEIHTFDGFFHDTLGERDRHLPIAKAREFLLRQFARTTVRASLADADSKGFTKDEFDRLQRPLSLWSPAGVAFGLTKLFLRTIGKLSDGIRLGCETGFDSGSSLDYVYRNQAAGMTPIGTLIDWFYLNSPGWTGIRARKLLLQELIGKTIRTLRGAERPVRILDVAAGHGRYVLEAIANSGVVPESVLLRDFDARNVELGRRLIAESGVAAQFEQGDAFDHASFAAIQPKPTLGIVSGLFELFPDNASPRAALAGLSDAIELGGYLIYTGQPWHPQLEFIARTLSSHRGGAAWVMRRRTQEELDELVRLAGFRKVEQKIDPDGLFTVTLAERVQ